VQPAKTTRVVSSDIVLFIMARSCPLTVLWDLLLLTPRLGLVKTKLEPLRSKKRREGNFVTGAVTPLLRVCYGSDLNFAPILPMCYGCYGSGGGKGGIHVLQMLTFPFSC